MNMMLYTVPQANVRKLVGYKHPFFLGRIK